LDYYTNSVLETRRFPGEYIWRNDWATFNGDERALTDDMKKMTKKSKSCLPCPRIYSGISVTLGFKCFFLFEILFQIKINKEIKFLLRKRYN
jgi:hypothetical protein